MWSNWNRFVLSTEGPACAKGINLAHPLSKGITKFTYNKSIEEELLYDREFNNFNGDQRDGEDTMTNPLEAHNFHKAAAYGLDGKGKTIHVVDSGFKINHSEFDDNKISVDPNGVRYAKYNWSTLKYDEHGLMVMGVIGADKGDGLLRGAAPKVNFKISDFTGSSRMNDAKYFSKATNWAYGSVAQNNSWGLPRSHEQFEHALTGKKGRCHECGKYNYKGNFTRLYSHLFGSTESEIKEWVNAMDRFQKKGVIVWSNPNTNGKKNGISKGKGPGIESMFPKYYPQLKEAFINVVNVDLVGKKGSGNETYDLRSEKCGKSASWCIAGDATSIKTLHMREGYYNLSKTGTSFMAPQVSSAIALVAQAFPTQTSEQWTARLLASANNKIKKSTISLNRSETGNNYSFKIIGYRKFGNGVKHGYSDAAGHGILDVYAALQPITSNNFSSSLYSTRSSTITNTGFELSNSYFRSADIVGDALISNARSVSNKFFDAMEGGFDYSISNDFLKSSTNISLLNFDSEFNSLSSFSSNDSNNKNENLSFTGSIIDLKSSNSPHRLITTLDKPLPSLQKLMSVTNNELSSFSKFGSSYLSDEEGGLGISYIGSYNNNKYYLGYSKPFVANGGEAEREYGSTEDINIGFDYNYGDSTKLFTVVGLSAESDALLGMTGSGAYNLEGSKSYTNYLATNFTTDFDNLKIYGQAVFGITNLTKPSNSIISDAKNIISNSYTAGLTKFKVFTNDNLTLQISQPPKIVKGDIGLDLVTDYDSKGNIYHENVKVSLKPTGTQIDLSLSYGLNIGKKLSFKYKGMLIQEPGHVKEAKSIINNFAGFVYDNHKFGIGLGDELDNDKPQYYYNYTFSNYSKVESQDLNLNFEINQNTNEVETNLSYKYKF